jgi:RNA polymerase sigma factor (sigma-70 family)
VIGVLDGLPLSICAHEHPQAAARNSVWGPACSPTTGAERRYVTGGSSSIEGVLSPEMTMPNTCRRIPLMTPVQDDGRPPGTSTDERPVVGGANSDDAELLTRSVCDPSAFAKFYERHGQSVRRYVARRVGAEAGEDLAAEVFVRAFRVRARYCAERDSALPWLLGVANHVIAGHRRTERRRLKALERLAGTSAEQIDHEDKHVGADVVRHLRRLPTADRDALLLVVWGELSYEEAANALGVPVGTVSSRIARSRRVLAAAIGATSRRTEVELHLKESTNA